MIFVRNPTGVSHSPAEFAERDDCLAGVTALTTVLADLAGAPSMTFTVLFVCTGNICRSPMAERLFAARADPALPFGR